MQPTTLRRKPASRLIFSLMAFVLVSTAAITVASVLLDGCVTVNVNFPESAVQKATDDYVKDLYRAKEKGTKPTASPAPTTWEQILLPSAYAADVPTSFSVNSDKALKIRDRLASRLDDVLAEKRAGVLGESNDGMLVLKNGSKLKKLQAKKVEKVVQDENNDRKDLYAKVVRANSLPSARLIDVQKSFARSFQAESPSGTWVQDTDGKWSQKP